MRYTRKMKESARRNPLSIHLFLFFQSVFNKNANPESVATGFRVFLHAAAPEGARLRTTATRIPQHLKRSAPTFPLCNVPTLQRQLDPAPINPPVTQSQLKSVSALAFFYRLRITQALPSGTTISDSAPFPDKARAIPLCG